MSATASTAAAIRGAEPSWRRSELQELEADLICQAQAGDRRAFEDLVCRYDRAVLRLAVRLTASEVEGQDVYQEAFFKAYKNIGRFRGQSSFYSWIYRIVTNVAMDHLRAQRSRREQSRSMINGPSDPTEHVQEKRPHADPERVVLQQELRRQIQFALNKLTERERIVFELKNYEGLRLRTVGEILNTSEETAKNTLFRAVRKLRSELAHLWLDGRSRSGSSPRASTALGANTG